MSITVFAENSLQMYDIIILKYNTMSTISVPIPHTLEIFIDEMIRRGVAPNKAEVVRQALVRFAEDQAVADVMRAEQEIKDGKMLRGDLKKLAKSMP